jgi:hypothetical protein
VVRRPWWPRGNPEPARRMSRLCLLTRQACGACVALVWHVWHLGKQSATRETLILQGFEARVALEALVFDLDLETKNRKMMFYLTPVKQIEPQTKCHTRHTCLKPLWRKVSSVWHLLHQSATQAPHPPHVPLPRKTPLPQPESWGSVGRFWVVQSKMRGEPPSSPRTDVYTSLFSFTVPIIAITPVL